MGAKYRWTCSECNFVVKTEGKSSRGFRYKCKCLKCKDCGSTGDMFVSTLNDNNEWIDILPTCGKCNSTNIVQWNFRCPSCQGKMIKDSSPFVHCD